jgi:C-terminal processing protease CtpA/Prc
LKQLYPDDKSIDSLTDFDILSDEMIRIIKEGKVKKFVIDLRFNHGGDSSLGENFILKLKNAIGTQDIKVYGLIGRGTYSSAVWNAVNLKNIANGILIGESTGGSPNSYGNTEISNKFVLPNSKLEINYTTKKVNISNKYTDTIIPDYQVEFTIKDFINGTDPLMDKIIGN